MLFTIIVSSIFLFITVSIGSWLSILFTRTFPSTKTFVFQNFLLGFGFISCYLNTWSLFLPANFYALAPVAILSIFVFKYSYLVVDKIVVLAIRLFKSSFVILTVPILLVILAYALLPPQHGDSPGYHFLTIRWNEEYKAIHGLANLHGRLGFNSSFFVSSAAFAFSRFAKQPLYSLNIVFVVGYYLWLLNKIYWYKSSLWSIVFLFIVIAMFRQLLDSISSPTPDVLATIIISYVFITIAESIFINNTIEQSQSIIILLLIGFAFTVKLNTFPLSFIALFLLASNRLYKIKKTLLVILGVGFIILIPWIIRNYILTGYLIFPVSATGFFHPDWKVPYVILHFEKLLINNGPKLISQEWEAVEGLSFTQWFPLWIKAHFEQGLTFSLLILTVSAICAISALFLIQRKQHPSLYWLVIINITSIVFWIYNSPDYRFGYPYLLNAVLLLALFLTRNKSLNFAVKLITATLVVVVCAYYIRHAAIILSPFPLSSFLIKPLQGIQYNIKNNISTFPFIMLDDKVKLFVEDKDHWCNMAGLPCYIPFTDSLRETRLQLRGNSIRDGFRIIQKSKK